MIFADNNFIKNKILASVAIMEAVPALRSLKGQISELEKACGTCGGAAEATKKLHEKWNEVRRTLLQLPESQRELIRSHFPNQRIRVSYRTGKGSQTKYPSGDL